MEASSLEMLLSKHYSGSQTQMRQYDWAVDRGARMVVAISLAMALGFVPLIADWCAASCEAALHSGPPSCHHVHSSGAHLAQLPAPCGHDHRPIVVDAATPAQAMSRAFVSPMLATGYSGLDETSTVMGGPSAISAPVGRSSRPLPLTLSSALRI